MSNAASLESKIAAVRLDTATARRSRKFAFRPTIGVSGHDGLNGEIVFAFADPRDELAAHVSDRRKKSVRKHLNKQSRLNGRRALHAERDVLPVKADAHCAGELTASIGRCNRTDVEGLPKKGTPERERLEQIRREPFCDTERRALAYREAEELKKKERERNRAARLALLATLRPLPAI